MKRLVPVLLVATAAAWAQHAPLINTGPRLQPPPNAYRFGNILFPGGISQTHPGRLGGTISGSLPHTGVRPGSHGRPPAQRTIVVPYAFPVYYPDPYVYQPPVVQQPPNVTVVVPQQPPPSVVINHNYGPDDVRPTVREEPASENRQQSSGGMRVYEAPAPQTAKPAEKPAAAMPVDDRPTIYLIVMKDSTIRQAIGYWVEGKTLHYVTPQGTVNHVTLDQLDRDASERFNAERKLDFDLDAHTRGGVTRE